MFPFSFTSILYVSDPSVVLSAITLVVNVSELANVGLCAGIVPEPEGSTPPKSAPSAGLPP